MKLNWKVADGWKRIGQVLLWVANNFCPSIKLHQTIDCSRWEFIVLSNQNKAIKISFFFEKTYFIVFVRGFGNWAKEFSHFLLILVEFRKGKIKSYFFHFSFQIQSEEDSSNVIQGIFHHSILKKVEFFRNSDSDRERISINPKRIQIKLLFNFRKISLFFEAC